MSASQFLDIGDRPRRAVSLLLASLGTWAEAGKSGAEDDSQSTINQEGMT